MSSLSWQRHWDPFRELQREVGRIFQSLEPVSPRVRRATIHRSTFTTQVIGT